MKTEEQGQQEGKKEWREENKVMEGNIIGKGRMDMGGASVGN